MFWSRNEENSFQICSLIWRPASYVSNIAMIIKQVDPLSCVPVGNTILTVGHMAASVIFTA